MKDVGVKGLRCDDIYGFDDEMLAFVPQPCYAVILCFPDYKQVSFVLRSTAHRICFNFQAFGYVKGAYDELKSKEYKNPENVFFMKQKIGNACGTFSLLHSIANIRNHVDIGMFITL